VGCKLVPFDYNSLDVNAELFTVKSGDRVTVAVARSFDFHPFI
jgi:hypothetical protein